MKALITGGAGFIGSHLSEVLLNRGWKVQILDDLSTGSRDNINHLTENPAFHYAIDSVLNQMVLDRMVSECDVIYHLAAAVGVELIVKKPVHTIRTNVEGTDCVLKAARRYHTSVVIASTSEVYGKSTNIPFREDSDTVSGPTTKHRWAYACSKAIDEFAAFAMAKETGQPVYVVRLFNTVGIRQSGRYGMVIPRFIQKALANEPIPVYGDGEQSRCFGNVTDIVRALAKLPLCEEAQGQVLNLGSNEEITINNLAQKIKEVLHSSSPIIHVPYDEAYEEGFEDMLRRVPCLKKAAGMLDFKPTINLEQTIREVADYMRESTS
jgi:UDP-glucose 4-epimerase